ncbi:hypothetical protein [Halapricum hydrolyticum]|uniref:Uncharacterized protein n=1 Tax=Halapricum hydrolyticum TaxID=2979991 RepID=A0AAE3LJ03_9EURY|nr:hypothetical protein [Halapricum hydrolyticum]MCU4719568.1 hypothetical protein [Halapricum hydrolyticum]MCU4728489.1 hypothetical protein [Halapricum hydrolyticum]
MDRDRRGDSTSETTPPLDDQPTPQIGEPTTSAPAGVTAYLDDIIAVLVPADHPEVAQALATGALQYRDGRPPLPENATPKDTFDLVRDFDAFDLSKVTDWANLPNTTPAESPLGSEILEQIRNAIDWEHEQTLLYDQYGNAFETPAALDSYLSEHDDLQLVLAVGYHLSGSTE